MQVNEWQQVRFNKHDCCLCCRCAPYCKRAEDCIIEERVNGCMGCSRSPPCEEWEHA